MPQPYITALVDDRLPAADRHVRATVARGAGSGAGVPHHSMTERLSLSDGVSPSLPAHARHVFFEWGRSLALVTRSPVGDAARA